jgi:hypothetical protein
MDKFNIFYKKKILLESPDKIDIIQYNKKSFTIGWASYKNAELISTFLKIGNQWFLEGVNTKNLNIGLKEETTHGDLLSKIIGHELVKVGVLDMLETFNYREESKNIPPPVSSIWTSNPPFFMDRAKTAIQKKTAKKIENFLNEIIRKSKILKNVDEIIKKGPWIPNVFINYLHNAILDATNPQRFSDPKWKETMSKINVLNPEDYFKKTAFMNFFTGVLEVEDARPAFHCGRLWLNPKKMPGLFISMWEQNDLSNEDKLKIQNELGKILKENGFKFSEVAWDGEEKIDLGTKHIQASKLKLPVSSMDDVLYGPPE